MYRAYGMYRFRTILKNGTQTPLDPKPDFSISFHRDWVGKVGVYGSCGLRSMQDGEKVFQHCVVNILGIWGIWEHVQCVLFTCL